MDWQSILVPIGSLALGGVITSVIPMFVTEKKAEALGERHGRWSTVTGNKKLGKLWEKIETVFQERIFAYMRGYIRGLDSDDAPKNDD